MVNHSGVRKGLRSAAAVAIIASAAIALPSTSASADRGTQEDIYVCNYDASAASDLSPSTQQAWKNFVCGGGHVTGGAARMVSGAWFGAPAIVVAATGGDLSKVQLAAWKNWDRGANMLGRGAAMVISGVYVGAPGYIIDKISAGAAPTDLSTSELDQVSFLMPADGANALPLPAQGADALPDPAQLLDVF